MESFRVPATSFRDRNNWSGGHYQLAFELGERDDEVLDRAFRALWAAARVDGCFSSGLVEPAEQALLDVGTASIALDGRFFGLVRPAGGQRCVCMANTVRVSTVGPDDGADWLILGLPHGGLARVDPRVGSFPFGHDGGEASLAWRRPIDDWLADVAQHVYRAVPFRLGLIGCEVLSGTTSAAQVGGTAPAERVMGYLLPRRGQLAYFPATL